MQTTQNYGDTIAFTMESAAARTLPLQTNDDGSVAIRFHAPAGLYQFSVVADAREFDWDELYENLTKYNNTGQRTGPWDFKLGPSSPLVPAYWVHLDGRRIGLWFFARVSLEDLAAKRFRGRMAFRLCEEGENREHGLKLVPYRPMKLRWIAARLETDPDDTLLAHAVSTPAAPTPVMRWREEAFWEEKRAQLETTHAMFHEPLRRAFDYALQAEAPAPNEWIALIAARRLAQRPGALEKLLQVVDEYIALPHWGNPREDGYSHDGDMHAAFPMRAFAWVYHGIGDELGEARRAQMREKIVLQGERFLDLCLLNRDYWGGSLLQDHGWRSIHTFTAAALNLLGVVPQAAEWLRYFLPRAERSLRAMPRDGVVPASSHNSLSLYLDDIGDLREAWLAWNGEDIFDEYPFHAVVDFVATVYARATPAAMIGGNGFFNQIATKYSDGRAAWIQQRLLQTPELDWSHFMQRQGYYSNVLRGFLSYDPSVPAEEPQSLQSLQFFADTGLAHFFDAENDIIFEVRCGPWVGHHADRHATGPCDRMGLAPGSGHFVVRRGATELLATPDAGYSLQSAIRSCLLIEGKGQFGDIGYPMSIPSKLHRGEEIESVRWDEATQTGSVRLHLTPAYPDEAGVAHYTREFLFAPRQIIVRDTVVLDAPKTLSWLFQGKRETGVELGSTLSARFGGESGVTLQAQPLGFEMQSAIHQSPVVWSYSSGSGFKPFDHVRFDAAPRDNATVDFVIRW
jgi:hypothetical protein